MIIWLASYPKSGNTWVRALLTNYFSENSENIFDEIAKINRFPSQNFFDGIVDKDLIKNNKLEIFKHFISAQEKINLNKSINIIKTHNFAGAINDFPFSDLNNTSGFIYVVRDPRSVLVSYSFHSGMTFGNTLKTMLNPNLISTNSDGTPEARLTWKIHLKSWLNNNWPRIVIKYEDLHKDTYKYFKQILYFLGKFKKIKIDEKKIKKTIEMCSFNNLADIEEKQGFIEKTEKSKFFRKGKVDEWKKELPKELIKEVEDNFREEMKLFGYL